MNKLPEEYCIINATANQIMEISKKYYGDTVGIVRNWEIFNCAKSLNYRSDRNRTHEQYIEFKYLPQFTYEEWKELYYSKEFVLPEKWRIEVTKENSKILTEWKLKVSNGYYNNKAGGFLYISKEDYFNFSLNDTQINSKLYEYSRKNSPVLNYDYQTIADQIILASIDSDDLEEVINQIKQKYS